MWDEFSANIAERASRLTYDRRASFLAERYLALLGPSMDVFLEPDGGHLPGSSATPVAASAPTPAKVARSILRSSPASVTFDLGSSTPASAAGATPAAPPPPPLPAPPALAPPPSALPLAPAPFGTWPMPSQALLTPPPWAGFGLPAGPPPPYFPATPLSPPPAAPATGRPGAPPSGRKMPFISPPLHAWIAGNDVATIPLGDCRQPPCKCARRHAGFTPGPHAIWDCPLRYWHFFNECPGFLSDGNRDPAQWNGDCLSAAAKSAWRALISKHNLTALPVGESRFPDFS